MPRTPTQAAIAELVDDVIRWYRHGNGQLFDDSGDPTNIGLKQRVERDCKQVLEERKRERNLKKELP